METFIFNLNKNEKYKKLQSNCSIFCDENYGSWVNYLGFYQTNQMRKIEYGGSGINTYFERGAEILPNFSSKIAYFNVKEVEVYQIVI